MFKVNYYFINYQKSNRIDEFDKKFGFIKRHNIDSKSNYEKVKLHYFRNH
jgi:hypothetical protein